MIIDAHAHVLPRDFPARTGFPRMLAVDRDSARTLMFGATNFRAVDLFFDVERRIEAMDAAGVDEEIVSPMPPLLNFGLEPAVGRELFRFVNDVMAEYAREGGGRIHSLGVVPLQDPALAIAELAHVQATGLRGVEVASHIAGVPIGDARFGEFFLECERRGLSIFVHTLPRADEVGLPAELRGSIGVGIEGARGAASLAFGGLAETGALDRVLFSHAAGGLPLMLARADYFWAQRPVDDRAAETPSAIARRFFYDSMVFDPRGLQFAVDYLGADRMVLGTDFPAMQRPSRLSDLLDPLSLSTDQRERIASGNARTFLTPSPSARRATSV